jgi:hypothetical protein
LTRLHCHRPWFGFGRGNLFIFEVYAPLEETLKSSDVLFQEHSTGSINNYILGVEDSLGPLTFLRIWHDNSGKGSKRGWFLDQVHVTDLQTGEK